MSFVIRAKQHDEEAMGLVCAILEKHGASTSKFGVEVDSSAFWELLRQQSDSTSIMLRFRPDRAAIWPGLRAALIEVKSTRGATRNFAIELDSYASALKWNSDEQRVLYALVDLDTETVKACWCSDLPKPSKIFIPMRNGYQERLCRIEQEWPGILIETKEYRNGSGTPYFLVWKEHPALKPLDSFITENVLQPTQRTLLEI